MKKKEAVWIEHFECSRCGEFSSKKKSECPFCHAPMRNRDRRDFVGGYQPKPCRAPEKTPTTGSNIRYWRIDEVKS